MIYYDQNWTDSAESCLHMSTAPPLSHALGVHFLHALSALKLCHPYNIMGPFFHTVANVSLKLLCLCIQGLLRRECKIIFHRWPQCQINMWRSVWKPPEKPSTLSSSWQPLPCCMSTNGNLSVSKWDLLVLLNGKFYLEKKSGIFSSVKSWSNFVSPPSCCSYVHTQKCLVPFHVKKKAAHTSSCGSRSL